jgi:arylsulfatase A-like enzyme
MVDWRVALRVATGLLLSVCARAAAGCAVADAGEPGIAPPNIVLIVADDLGWRDAGFMGSDFYETPSLDRLAAQGMVFSDAYANAANCAPSRAALMSGQYGPRTGVYTVGSPNRGKAVNRKILTIPNSITLESEVVTLAESLRDAGYATGMMGKWHLGADDKRSPLGQGFDVNIGGNQAGHPKSYFSPYKNPDIVDGAEGEYLTDRLTDEAISFVRANKEGPFFLYLPSYAVHTPLQPKPSLLEKYQNKPSGERHTNARYAAMVEAMDTNVGRLIDAIDGAGLGENTLVVFTSDNGGLGRVTTMDPLRGSKGMFYEGGIRVPMIARLPGMIEAGSTCNEPVIGVDLYPTLVEVAGATVPSGQPLDGVSLVGLLQGKRSLAPRALFWHFPAYLESGGVVKDRPWRTTPCGAIRMGPWKLIEYFEDGKVELYNLKTDIGERTDLAAIRPEVRDRLYRAMTAWRDEVNAPVPREPNPKYKQRSETSLVPQWEPRPITDRPAAATGAPNIVYILADDLGYAELGCYGQTKIATPNIDRLAARGMRFTQHYSGSAVCAPARGVLMTGYHTGHSYVRNNRGLPNAESQQPIPAEVVTVGELMQGLGYQTACIGKWGLGGLENEGHPNDQGFDHWFGYLDQRHAHTHYPDYLWRNRDRVEIPGNRGGRREAYSQDLLTAEALAFIDRRDERRPFFLYLPYIIPHVSLDVTEASLALYTGRWPETPFAGGHYSANETPRAAYAAMVSHMDRDVGKIMALLDEKGLADNTLVIFASDNGPTFNGGADSKFFESAGPYRGLKGSLFEGGIRVPMIARWPGTIAAGSETNLASAFEDVLPTLVEIGGGQPPAGIDGLSMVPTLTGVGEQAQHDVLYWELGSKQAVRAGRWKLVRVTDRKGKTTAMLFDIEADERETNDLADDRPDVLERLIEIARKSRTVSKVYPSVYDDGR